MAHQCCCVGNGDPVTPLTGAPSSYVYAPPPPCAPVSTMPEPPRIPMFFEDPKNIHYMMRMPRWITHAEESPGPASQKEARAWLTQVCSFLDEPEWVAPVMGPVNAELQAEMDANTTTVEEKVAGKTLFGIFSDINISHLSICQFENESYSSFTPAQLEQADVEKWWNSPEDKKPCRPTWLTRLFAIDGKIDYIAAVAHIQHIFTKEDVFDPRVAPGIPLAFEFDKLLYSEFIDELVASINVIVETSCLTNDMDTESGFNSLLTDLSVTPIPSFIIIGPGVANPLIIDRYLDIISRIDGRAYPVLRTYLCTSLLMQATLNTMWRNDELTKCVNMVYHPRGGKYFLSRLVEILNSKLPEKLLTNPTPWKHMIMHNSLISSGQTDRINRLVQLTNGPVHDRVAVYAAIFDNVESYAHVFTQLYAHVFPQPPGKLSPCDTQQATNLATLIKVCAHRCVKFVLSRIEPAVIPAVTRKLDIKQAIWFEWARTWPEVPANFLSSLARQMMTNIHLTHETGITLAKTIKYYYRKGHMPDLEESVLLARIAIDSYAQAVNINSYYVLYAITNIHPMDRLMPVLERLYEVEGSKRPFHPYLDTPELAGCEPSIVHATSDQAYNLTQYSAKYLPWSFGDHISTIRRIIVQPTPYDRLLYVLAHPFVGEYHMVSCDPTAVMAHYLRWNSSTSMAVGQRHGRPVSTFAKGDPHVKASTKYLRPMDPLPMPLPQNGSQVTMAMERGGRWVSIPTAGPPSHAAASAHSAPLPGDPASPHDFVHNDIDLYRPGEELPQRLLLRANCAYCITLPVSLDSPSFYDSCGADRCSNSSESYIFAGTTEFALVDLAPTATPGKPFCMSEK